MSAATRLFPSSPKPRTGTVSPVPKAVKVVVARAARDPRFLRIMEKLQESAAKAMRHPPAQAKAAQAQAAAQAPPNEKIAGGKVGNIDDMQQAKSKKPESGGFLTLLRSAIDQVMPKNLDDADKFMKGGEKEQIKGAVGGNVKQQKDAAAGPTKEAAQRPPDEGRTEGKDVSPVPADPANPHIPVDGAAAMPAPQPNAEVEGSAQKTQDSAEKEMRKAEEEPGATQETYQTANDPRFSSVLVARKEVALTAKTSAQGFRIGESVIQAQAAAQARSFGANGTVAISNVQARTGAGVRNKQTAAQARDEAERKSVTDRIEAIFLKTKTKVEEKLASLETDVMALFDAGAETALSHMKSWASNAIDRFKEERYSGVEGKIQWGLDLFRPVPEGIKRILTQARQNFTTEMDGLIVRVAYLVETRIGQAKDIAAAGQSEVKTLVVGLPTKLRSVGQQAEQDVGGRFDELRSGIEDRKNDLAQKLAQKYKETSEKADAEVKKLEEANQGAFKKLADKLGEVVQILREFKDRVVSLFKKAAGVIKKIVDNPIKFLGNLLSAIKQGISQFVGNIWTHIKRGFMTWLFGELTKTGVAIPTDLSLPSILKLVLSVLGLTWGNIRPKVVARVGERAVAVMEKVVEILYKLFTAGPAALWEEMKAFLGDLKQMVIDAILDWVITKVITSAITKIASMFNPAGAIIQAIVMIYQVGSWLIANINRILEFIESVVNSVDRIANGDVGGAASFIEQALARTIPILIGFLASLLGISGIADKVKSFIQKVQAKVSKAVDWVLDKVIATVKKVIAAVKGVFAKRTDERSEAQKGTDLKKAMSEAQTLLDSKKLKPSKLKAKFAAIKTKYKMTSLELVTDAKKDGTEIDHIEGVINPTAKGDPVEVPTVDEVDGSVEVAILSTKMPRQSLIQASSIASLSTKGTSPAAFELSTTEAVAKATGLPVEVGARFETKEKSGVLVRTAPMGFVERPGGLLLPTERPRLFGSLARVDSEAKRKYWKLPANTPTREKEEPVVSFNRGDLRHKPLIRKPDMLLVTPVQVEPVEVTLDVTMSKLKKDATHGSDPHKVQQIPATVSLLLQNFPQTTPIVYTVVVRGEVPKQRLDDIMRQLVRLGDHVDVTLRIVRR